MANFEGHALPGSFFIIFGLWLCVKYSLKYHIRKMNKDGRTYRFFEHMEVIEGTGMIICSVIGILAEQFVPSGPHLALLSGEPRGWVKLMNWQHSTMYLFFGISGAMNILTYSSIKAPKGLDHLGLSVALFVEGFLFYYHVMNRPMLDRHIHSLLLTAVFAGSFCCLMEVFQQDNMVLQLFRASLFFLQGTWFWQIGFVLYPPLGGPQWNEEDHENVMFITMCFCWHYATSIFLVAISYTLTYCCFGRCRKNNGQIEIGLGVRKKKPNESSHTSLLNESDDE